MTLPTDVDQQAVIGLLQDWIYSRIDEKSKAWVENKSTSIAGGEEAWIFFTSFSAVPRYTGKAELNLSASQLQEAGRLRDGWDPSYWSVDQATRALMVLSLPSGNAEEYLATLKKVFQAADIGELVALNQCLPLYPYPDRFVEHAQEGLRSNMTSVFEAVALRNPFPAEYFEENAWNQLVLKACFVGSSLNEIVGLDRRANPALARMLVDYAHERWAASRSVLPELWRPVGPFVSGAFIQDLKKALESEEPANQAAAALALSMSAAPEAAELLSSRPDLKERIEKGSLTWESVSDH